MAKKRILVTGIGGNVGQGILRNIISLNLDIELFGSNTIEFSAGNHFCKKVFLVPFAFSETYISIIKKIVEENKIDLIIPSTDYEVFYLGKNKSLIPCEIAVSEANTSNIYLDKYKSFLHHKQHNLPFANSYLPSEYKGPFKEIIAKPREGRGSRGLFINPSDITNFSDDEYVIQEFHTGKEITTAFYVTKEGKLHGLITMDRSLENGTTIECEVIKMYDDEFEKIILKMIEHSEFRGGINLQSIVTSVGLIVPFEINCRISGTNSIRSNFGFKDVKYTLQEYLYNEKPDIPKIIGGKAIRVLMDIIYPEPNSLDNKVNPDSYIF